MQGKVIFFDGASSSGKSTIIKKLVPLLNANYSVLTLDDFVSPIFIEQQKLNEPFEVH